MPAQTIYARRENASLPSRGKGFFSPDSLTFRINREAVLLLGGSRALLMQIAHPLVAQGVADHSSFQKDPLGRLLRTLFTMLDILFGTEEEATRASAYIARRHQKVKGKLKESAGSYRRGTQYFAEDPELLLWVYATLHDTSIYAYELFVRELTEEEKETYYRESRRVAPLLRIPEKILPTSQKAFEQYLEKMLHSNQIAVSPTGKALADAILHPKLLLVPRHLFEPHRFLTIGMLPPVLKEKFGFTWTPLHQLAFEAAATAIRKTLPFLPRHLRYLPQSHRARRRWKKDARTAQYKT